jgi:acylpyruvate hydrolase
MSTSPILRAYAGTKIVAVAKNYAKHKVEMGGTPAKLPSPAIFLKPNSSVVRISPSPSPSQSSSSSSVVIPRAVTDLHHEVELGVVIGARCKRARASDWRSYVSGYCVGLDMTARDHQSVAKRDGMPWTLGKCWDTFTPLSAAVPASSVPDPHALELYLRVGDVERQRGSTGDMLARIPELIEFISSVMTLEEGDVILTGTPEGVGPVVPGNVITAGITGLIEIRVPVVAESE